MFKRNRSELVDITPTAPADSGENLMIKNNPSIAPADTLDLQANQHVSIISNDLTILGSDLKIISEGAIRVDGEIQGEIRGIDVTVGRHGKVVGTVSGQRVKIDGEVSGAIKADQVMFSANARVDGEVQHQTLSIDQGARFDGSSKRREYVALVKPEIEPPAPDIVHLQPSVLAEH